MSQNLSKNANTVEQAYHGLARLLFDKASAACDRLDSDDPEALHDFRVALRRLRTHLSTHRDHLGRRAAKQFQRRLSALVASTNTSRDQDVQREWIQRHLATTDVAGTERDGLNLMLTRFCANGNGTSDLEPIRQDFYEIGRQFTKRHWSLPERAQVKGSPAATVTRVTKSAIVRLTAKIRKQIDAIESVDSVSATHRLRLAVKRLRYILEPLNRVTPGASNAIDELKPMQDTLGAIRDLQILHLQIALAAGVADELGEETPEKLPGADAAAPASSPPKLDDAEREALDAALDHVRVEAEREFKVLQERWLDTKAAPLLKRIEKLVSTL